MKPVKTLCWSVVAFLVPSWLLALTAVVSVPPYQPIVQELLGPDATVIPLLPAGQSCELYQPRPSQLRELANADLVVLVGVAYEDAWRHRLATLAPRAVIVDLAEAPCEEPHDDHEDHEHHEHGHDHDGHDHHEAHDHHLHGLHAWMNPGLVREQVAQIAAGVKQLPGMDAAEVDLRAEALRERLALLDAQVRAVLAPFRERLLISHHPSFTALEAYGIETQSLEHAGSQPSPGQLRALIHEAREGGTRTIYVQPQDPTAAAERVAQAVGGKVEELDPMVADYFANLLAIVQRLASNWQAEHERD